MYISKHEWEYHRKQCYSPWRSNRRNIQRRNCSICSKLDMERNLLIWPVVRYLQANAFLVSGPFELRKNDVVHSKSSIADATTNLDQQDYLTVQYVLKNDQNSTRPAKYPCTGSLRGLKQQNLPPRRATRFQCQSCRYKPALMLELGETQCYSCHHKYDASSIYYDRNGREIYPVCKS